MDSRPERTDEIDLFALISLVIGRKWMVFGVTSIMTVAAVLFALTIPDSYRAEALLVPNDSNRAGELASLASRYAALANLAGVSLDRGSDKTALGLEILNSRKFISDFISKHGILVPLIAGTGWNDETRELVLDSGRYDEASMNWVVDDGSSGSGAPSAQEAYDAFMKLLSVEKNKDTGFITVAIEHYSPIYAKQWVDLLIADLNETMMNQDVAKAEGAISYLTEQVQLTALADLQEVFFLLIQEQIQTVILAKASDEYFLSTIDPAVVPEKKFRPKRTIIVAIGFTSGVLLSICLALLLPYRRNSIPNV